MGEALKRLWLFAPTEGVVANLSPFPKFRAFNLAGTAPLAGGKLYTYAAGTTTPLATYTDSTEGTTNANPVVLNAAGEANVWLAATSRYKLVLKDASDSTLWTVDDIPGIGIADLTGQIVFSGVLTPTILTASQNNYNPAGLSLASTLRISSDAPYDITGMAGGESGRLMFIFNVGSYPITLKKESTSSTAANRFALVDDIIILANGGALLKFDGTSSRWRSDSDASGATTVNLVNLVPNSDFAVCSVLLPTRVGSPIAFSSYTTYPSSGSGLGQFVCASAGSGHAGGITPGKLMLAEGAGTPHVAHSALTATVTSNKRITAASSSFTGVEVGDWFYLTGGTNTSPRIAYKVIATDANTYVEIFGGTSGSILTNESATFSMTWYQGSKDVDPTVNGMPAAPLSYFEAQPGFSLQATAIVSGAVYASLSGWYGDANNSSAGQFWELTPGDEGWLSQDGPDGMMKTPTLRMWRTFDKDWDGTTSVTKPGSLYGIKVKKGAATAEKIYWPLCQQGAYSRDKVNPGILAQYLGRTITFGMWWKSPSSSTARPFIYDGTTTTYADVYYTSGDFYWLEVSVTIPVTATTVWVGVEVIGAVGDIHYGTQPMSVYGSGIGEGNYVPWHGTLMPTNHQHPLRYVSSPTIPTTQAVKLEQETNGYLGRGVKGVFLDLEGRNRSTSSVFLMDGSETYMPGIVLLSMPEPCGLPFGTGSTGITDGTTAYIGVGNVSTTEADAQFPAPFTGTIEALFTHRAAAASGSIVYTLRLNGADTALTTGAVSSPTKTGSDTNTGHAVSVTAGDLLCVKAVASGGADTVLHHCMLRASMSGPEVCHMFGLVSVGQRAAAYPSGYYLDAMFLQCNTSGWYEMTIDTLAYIL